MRLVFAVDVCLVFFSALVDNRLRKAAIQLQLCSAFQ